MRAGRSSCHVAARSTPGATAVCLGSRRNSPHGPAPGGLRRCYCEYFRASHDGSRCRDPTLWCLGRRRREAGVAAVMILEDVGTIADPPCQSPFAGADRRPAGATRRRLLGAVVARGLRGFGVLILHITSCGSSPQI